ncbi:MAG: hypothetical protein AVDCRST_MAG53-2899 [uncultured Solirubrobacteraceae bacterium]|uniref:histidine kinase n=1 Tax=uncultured Solirubrobacteraceae bacterium TaxID=1162706 RepID=A0A6J4T3Y9_9ACTN|nr:MAG: hypothetical protein AVDCRST_MAG53-2899 [uncultured Solirubrobacteraceae bacterium]
MLTPTPFGASPRRLIGDMLRRLAPEKGATVAVAALPVKNRIGRLDVSFTLVLVALGLLLMYSNVQGDEGPPNLSVFAIPAFLPIPLALLWRSSDPTRALGAVVLALVVHFAVFGEVVRCGVAFAVIALLTFSAGARCGRQEALVALAIGVVAAVIVGISEFLGPGVLVVGVPLALASWAFGRVARSRGQLAGELRARNQQLRSARDERARLEVATDRAQLSGELDALLQRRLGALAQLADRGAESVADGTAAAVLLEIEHESRATLDEMRTLVGVLRSDDGRASVAPQPTLISLDALLLSTKGGQLSVKGSPRALPAGVELSAYRVVEHLLDALENASGVKVEVRFAPDALELLVEGPARRRSEVTTALSRARERVELHRGSLETSTHGGWATAAVALPLRAGV